MQRSLVENLRDAWMQRGCKWLMWGTDASRFSVDGILQVSIKVVADGSQTGSKEANVTRLACLSPPLHVEPRACLYSRNHITCKSQWAESSGNMTLCSQLHNAPVLASWVVLASPAVSVSTLSWEKRRRVSSSPLRPERPRRCLDCDQPNTRSRTGKSRHEKVL